MVLQLREAVCGKGLGAFAVQVAGIGIERIGPQTVIRSEQRRSQWLKDALEPFMELPEVLMHGPVRQTPPES